MNGLAVKFLQGLILAAFVAMSLQLHAVECVITSDGPGPSDSPPGVDTPPDDAFDAEKQDCPSTEFESEIDDASVMDPQMCEALRRQLAEDMERDRNEEDALLLKKVMTDPDSSVREALFHCEGMDHWGTKGGVVSYPPNTSTYSFVLWTSTLVYFAPKAIKHMKLDKGAKKVLSSGLRVGGAGAKFTGSKVGGVKGVLSGAGKVTAPVLRTALGKIGGVIGPMVSSVRSKVGSVAGGVPRTAVGSAGRRAAGAVGRSLVFKIPKAAWTHSRRILQSGAKAGAGQVDRLARIHRVCISRPRSPACAGVMSWANAVNSGLYRGSTNAMKWARGVRPWSKEKKAELFRRIGQKVDKVGDNQLAMWCTRQGANLCPDGLAAAIRSGAGAQLIAGYIKSQKGIPTYWGHGYEADKDGKARRRAVVPDFINNGGPSKVFKIPLPAGFPDFPGVELFVDTIKS